MGLLVLQYQAAPSTPSSQQAALYFKSDGLLYWKDQNGVEYAVSSGSGTISYVTNTLGADVNCNNTGTFFDGPSCAQGTVGTWFASGTVTIEEPGGIATGAMKLHDGTTVIASTSIEVGGGAQNGSPVALSGVIVNPAGNIRMSAKLTTSTSGHIKFNITGLSKDSTLTVVRLA